MHKATQCMLMQCCIFFKAQHNMQPATSILQQEQEKVEEPLTEQQPENVAGKC